MLSKQFYKIVQLFILDLMGFCKSLKKKVNILLNNFCVILK